MTKAARFLAISITIIVAGLHVGFLALEMFFWTHPIGLSVFSMTMEDAEASAVLAANPGLYNGFLAAGILWSLIRKQEEMLYFFLACVIVAGAFGALTASPTIFLVQAMPAILAALFLFLSRPAR